MQVLPSKKEVANVGTLLQVIGSSLDSELVSWRLLPRRQQAPDQELVCGKRAQRPLQTNRASISDNSTYRDPPAGSILAASLAVVQERVDP